MEQLKQSGDALFILLGAILVLAMHAGFAFLELGTVRKKNQVNALVKIMVDFSVSTVAYFFVGYAIAYGTSFFVSAESLAAKNGYDLVKFFFLLTFAAAIPAIVSGGIAERARFGPQAIATAALVALIYPVFEGVAWNQRFGVQAWIKDAHRRRVPRLRRQRGGARGRRLDRAGRRAAARRAQQPLSQGWRDQRAPAVVDPVSGARRLGAVGGLVRLQRDERADDRQDLGPGRGEFADGDGRRHAGGHAAGPQRPGLRAQRAAGRAGGHLRGLRRDASGRRAGGGRRGRRDLRRACSR